MTTKKVTLFFAPTTVFKKHTEAQAPPLSLGFFDVILREKGYEVTAINSNNFGMFQFFKKDKANIILNRSLEEIKKSDPDYLVISSWTYGMPFTLELTKKLKQILPNTPIILGGHNVSFLPQQTIKLCTNVDYFVIGEGWITLPELLETLNQNKNINHVKGIGYKNGKVNLTPPRGFLTDYSKLPIVDFQSFKDAKDVKDFYLMASLGCVYNCTFCSDNAVWHGFKTFPVDYMLKQVKTLQDHYGDIRITFWDSVFTMAPDWGKQFFKKADLNLRWSSYSRIDEMTKFAAKNMKKHGCEWVFFGVETTNPKTLEFFKKTKDPKAYINSIPKSLKLMHKHSITPIVSYIVGSPTENKTELLSNITQMTDWKKEFPETQFELSPLTLEVNSPLWVFYKQKRFDMFRSSNPKLKNEYTGVQLFSEKYADNITIAPQEYLFQNNYLSNQEFENTMIQVLQEYHTHEL